MARVTAYPTGEAARGLRKAGARITARTNQGAPADDIAIWSDITGQWQPPGITWHRPLFTDWQDCADKWSDCSSLWDAAPAITAQAFIRKTRTLYNAPIGAYKRTADALRTYAAAWRQLTHQQRADWQSAATTLNEQAYPPTIDPRTGRPRFATPRALNGFALFAAEARASGAPPTQSPSDPNRQEQPTMTELLTGNDYEQRINAALAATSGRLTIVMYQVSPIWSQPGLPASALFDALLAQPTRRPQCRLILGRPPTASTLATLNDEAATLLANAGWYVRRVPAYPVLHAKLWLIERGYLYAGSHNLSNRATTSNTEAGIITTNAAAVESARQFCEGQWNAAI